MNFQVEITHGENSDLAAEITDPASGAQLASAYIQSGTIWSVRTDPTKRRSGLGSVLMTELIHAAAVRGYPRLDLLVARDNTPAIALYERLGFAVEPDDPDQCQVSGFARMHLPLRKANKAHIEAMRVQANQRLLATDSPVDLVARVINQLPRADRAAIFWAVPAAIARAHTRDRATFLNQRRQAAVTRLQDICTAATFDFDRNDLWWTALDRIENGVKP